MLSSTSKLLPHGLYQVVKNIKFETKGSLQILSLALSSYTELLKTWLHHLEKLPNNEENLKTFAGFIYDPIKSQKGHPNAPFWCIVFVDLLRYALQFEEWTHTISRHILSRTLNRKLF